ncbi:23S rRNA pseudouridine955/2504/2580 synthase [Marinitoga hydrogenitolerans DSM 16785]|uniref:Ribosomal large subunit pseudouridine synthase C n=1 Tax=Marinitoga hydrogenitolerans (strain DSM 16785 / JCM 12826 / AT1271) TaxID=1122195 RepID=A0A1M4S5E9_MARH1|nr:RluA family pseudouridine synthase [Marinitoga hydrogenitolerans]SHE27237.1 23S rRNA pseudouridine955/2504/2580 synthase [Marinitoga hydrogenitolerans DSM 16785]
MQQYIIVNEKNYYKRLDKFLRNNFSDLKLGFIYKLIRKGFIYINGKRIKKQDFELNIGDKVEVRYKGPFEERKKENKILPRPLDFEIIFEDRDIISINKPAGISIHPGKNEEKVTIIEGLLYYAKGKFEPHLVHRLDKHTSGVLVIAKSKQVARELTDIIKGRDIIKKYQTLIIGKLKGERKKLESLFEDKKAVLYYSILNNYKIKKIDLTLVDIELKTGRKHQIRKQFANMGFPVAGDNKYGNFEINRDLKRLIGLKRYFLHSYYLEFRYKNKNYSLISNLTPDLKKVLERLEG